MRTFTKLVVGAALLCTSAIAAPLQSSDVSSNDLTRRADSYVGYLGAFFLGDKPDVYFYLSNGNVGTSFTALNGGQPILVPTKGTGGVRDPAIIQGGGSEAGKKWYIIGTDLDIANTTWGASQQTGSRGILVWESTDLVNWTGERLVNVETSTAGMVWAPEAIWDAEKGQYLVFWSSKFYATTDKTHTGTASAIKIRSSYTKDFKTFTKAVDYINYSPTNIIDLTITSTGGNTWSRFIKDETNKGVFQETSTTGLRGTWNRIGGSSSFIAKGVEGPAVFHDNLVDGKAYLLLDDYSGAGGYIPYETTSIESGQWTRSVSTNFPRGVRHGSVIPVNQVQYSALGSL